MNIRSIFSAMMFVPVAVAVAAPPLLPQGFADAVAKTGRPYREAVAVVTCDANAAEVLQTILAQEPADSVKARQSRILIARIQHPKLFAEFENNINEWRSGEKTTKPSYGRPGLLSGMLLLFVELGPQNKYVYVRDDAPERNQSSSNGLIARGLYRKKVEKYTDAEVQAGIARNAAARQAVLERFLKFLDDGGAYEQSEMVDLVNRLWGRHRNTRMGDYAVTDHVSDSEALIATVFRDESRPALARMVAAFCLAGSQPNQVRDFMLGLVTNTPTGGGGEPISEFVDKALVNLESSADANTLAVLKNQTNGPAWKREKIVKASQVIESRLVASPKDK